MQSTNLTLLNGVKNGTTKFAKRLCLSYWASGSKIRTCSSFQSQGCKASTLKLVTTSQSLWRRGTIARIRIRTSSRSVWLTASWTSRHFPCLSTSQLGCAFTITSTKFKTGTACSTETVWVSKSSLVWYLKETEWSWCLWTRKWRLNESNTPRNWLIKHTQAN